MSKLRYVSAAVRAALQLPAAVWGAGASSAAGSASIPATGETTQIERLKAQLELQQRQILQIASEEHKKLGRGYGSSRATHCPGSAPAVGY